ncbi:hypothetical protein [Plantactinospora sp. GCM10030261]|uniref:EamA family transporter n=1 Tax=Plantactinospora sp. GCM10030261 TaxID=3273420 RepID=UPI00361F9F02
MAAVLVAAVLHATWNALVKGVADQVKLFTRLGVVSATITVVSLPWIGLPAAESWPWVIASAIIHIGYNVGLLAAYRLGDFGQTYPLARGLGPVIATGIAYLAIAEPLPPPALVGVLLVSAAIAVLGLTPWHRVRANRPAVVAALLTGLTIGSYTVIDGIGVRLSGNAGAYTLVLVGLQGLGTIPLLAWWARRKAANGPTAGSAAGVGWGQAIAVTMLSIGAYGLVLWAQTKGALGAIAALRESSVVVAALIGAVVFRESLSRLRIAASVVITAGVVLLATAGG